MTNCNKATTQSQQSNEDTTRSLIIYGDWSRVYLDGNGVGGFDFMESSGGGRRGKGMLKGR